MTQTVQIQANRLTSGTTSRRLWILEMPKSFLYKVFYHTMLYKILNPEAWGDNSKELLRVKCKSKSKRELDKADGWLNTNVFLLVTLLQINQTWV